MTLTFCFNEGRGLQPAKGGESRSGPLMETGASEGFVLGEGRRNKATAQRGTARVLPIIVEKQKTKKKILPWGLQFPPIWCVLFKFLDCGRSGNAQISIGKSSTAEFKVIPGFWTRANANHVWKKM